MLALLSTLLLAPPVQDCPDPALPPVCEALLPGTPLPFTNGAAPAVLALPPGTTEVDLVILGHSENKGYHNFLQPLLDANPPVAGVQFTVTNLYIGGHEAFDWATPGSKGWKRIEDVVNGYTQHPVIALGLFSNNATFPIGAPSAADPNWQQFVADLEAILDHLRQSPTLLATYLTAHRYKPFNFLPCWWENCAVGDVFAAAEAAGLGDVKPGPALHDAHWCCFPTCYAGDQAHTNMQGDELMAEAWYNLLVAELTGCSSLPYGQGSPGGDGLVPVLKPAGAVPFPSLGNADFGLAATHVPGSAAAFFAIGDQAAPGPFLVEPDFLFAGTPGPGFTSSLALPVPANPVLAGAVFYAQAGFLDGGAAGGVATTQGLELRLCP